MIKNLDHWYDGQQRRFLEQVIRAFSGFQYQTGSRNGQPPQLVTVPCRMATQDRMVASISKNNSENIINSAPMITVAQTGLTGRRDAVQYPGFIDTLQVAERKVMPNGSYGNEKGESYTVQRLMPRPFDMMMQVDIWTTNMDQKYQLAEQILTIIYPTFDIQNSENGLDWTALSMMMVEDITWTSRSIPAGGDVEMDIMTIQLRLPIWLSPPAKVKHQKIIQQIVTNLRASDVDEPVAASAADGDILVRSIVTPGDFAVRAEGSVITLLVEGGAEYDINGDLPSWSDLLKVYGELRPGLSEIRLIAGDDPEGTSINGTMQLGGAVNELLWVIDPLTLPANTLVAVDAVIDPLKTYPGSGLPDAAEGVRYLLLNDIAPSVAWGGVLAHENDIIQYVSGAWTISFQAIIIDAQLDQYVLNNHSGRQLHWTGREWVMAIDAEYGPGFWRLSL